jgi:ferredoxin
MAYKNPEDQRRNTNSWYQRNREQHMAATARNKERYRQMWIAYKSTKECVHCGASHPAIIDFHHVLRKNTKKVHKLAANGAYKQAVKEAEDKCIALCSNCHRILHWNEVLARQDERRLQKEAETD